LPILGIAYPSRPSCFICQMRSTSSSKARKSPDRKFVKGVAIIVKHRVASCSRMKSFEPWTSARHPARLIPLRHSACARRCCSASIRCLRRS
jgi:hypothetical protein